MKTKSQLIPGIPEEDSSRLLGLFTRYPAVRQLILYGSRAKGTYKRGSDIDLCVAESNIDLTTELALEREIDDLLLPYMVDLCVYEKIDNRELRAHIDRVGLVIYEH
jgi:predicted nucleotidyltransferase